MAALGSSNPSILGTGFKHVEKFSQEFGGLADDGEDAVEEQEWEELEDMYITLDFGTHGDTSQMGVSATHGPSAASSYSLIALDTATPFLKLNNQIFKGSPEELVGSEIIFKERVAEANQQQQYQRAASVVEGGEEERERPIQPSIRSRVFHPLAVTSHRISFKPIKATIKSAKVDSSGISSPPKRKAGRPKGAKTVNRKTEPKAKKKIGRPKKIIKAGDLTGDQPERDGTPAEDDEMGQGGGGDWNDNKVNDDDEEDDLPSDNNNNDDDTEAEPSTNRKSKRKPNPRHRLAEDDPMLDDGGNGGAGHEALIGGDEFAGFETYTNDADGHHHQGMGDAFDGAEEFTAEQVGRMFEGVDVDGLVAMDPALWEDQS